MKNLIAGFQKGDWEVFPVIYDEFKKLITLYSYRINDEDANAELMLFFIELLYSIDMDRFNYIDSNSLSKYIAVCIRNKYIELSKKFGQYRSNLLHLCENCVCADTLNCYIRLETVELLKELSLRQRAVIVYKYIYKYTDTEISEMLGVSRQAINRLKNRALKQLRKLY